MGVETWSHGKASAPRRVRRRHAAFRRDLHAPALTLLTIGGVMGSGLFLASGLAIRDGGPGTIVLFLVGALAMYLEIRALGEMSAATPAPGSFLTYAAQVLGPGYTFVAGWIFWFSSVLTMSSEVTAAALFSRYWVPSVPLWLWALAYSAGIIALNFLSVRGFGTAESVMAGVKTAAVLLFVILAAVALSGALPRLAAVPAGARAAAATGWFPHGWRGLAAGFILVLFSYAGTGVVGMAAAETADPARTIRRSIRLTVALVGVLYLGSIAAVVLLLPEAAIPTTHSPFVAALHRLPLPFAGAVMNLVLLFAVLSTMNAALYSNVRVLYSLARHGQAPARLGVLNRRGQPAAAIWTSAGLLGLTIILAYVLPHKAYAYLVTATGFQAMFIWLMVLLTHLRYRPYLEAHAPEQLQYKLWGFPYTTWFVIAVILTAMAGSFFSPSELAAAILAFAGILLAVLAWLLVRRRLRLEPTP
ncbi:Amino acid transporter, AAT family [Candidatus Hydrogenisulfobacillus filiaventi]|uniref:Amino acid transporter, AAT family n=1 Tax=Candidatus Hydrogenisulfobacillus filiaventi TaxID=2707344 RepID=A0A6F8ZHW2_9FIRM|nr:amino acid permease [Bacillota bacterium]CAB1129242.1 Amino acid transporter, AAT family [Candidatus Hydrogenisulfobacillus filiaventi]